METKQEEMKSLGVIGIHKESLKIIFSWKNWKIFSLITFTILLPLSIICFTYIQLSNLLSTKIIINTQKMNHFHNNVNTPHDYYHPLSHLVSSEWATFWLLQLFYIALLLIFSLVSTSAVVATVTSSDVVVTFYEVMSVFPKVWKRLMVTFMCGMAALFTYHVMAMLVIVIVFTVTIGQDIIMSWGMVFVWIGLAIVLLCGDIYVTAIWDVASVVSVLEDRRGMEAMMRSKELMKGKTRLGMLIFLNLKIASLLVLAVGLYVQGTHLGYTYGAAFCVLMLSVLSLFWLVIQTVFYFVCKSNYGEINGNTSCISINDDSALSDSDDLQLYLGEYEPSMKPKDVQLDQHV